MARRAGGDRRPVRKKLDSAKKTARAVRLAGEGKSYRQIAAEMGWGKSHTHRVIRRAIGAVKQEAVDEAVAKYTAFCDAMLEGLAQEGAFKGSATKVMAACKAMERVARFLGLDKPKRTEISGPDGGPLPFGDERNELLGRLAGLADREAAGQRAASSDPEAQPGAGEGAPLRLAGDVGPPGADRTSG